MSIHELIKVVAPPINPIEVGEEEDWQSVETQLGIDLPKDLHDLCETYGSGCFMGIEIYNPFSSAYLDFLRQDLEIYRDLKRDLGSDSIPFNFYPDAPGLLPCATQDQGGEIFWLVDGPSDTWAIVLFERLDFQILQMPLTTFLTKTFAMELPCIWWDLEWQQEEFAKVEFQPKPMA